ncbi:ATP-dependent DNA helicase RecG [Helcobacillus massiliensis]|uniref:ATP-dependent DNA helicase RecG n=1 Tax=Helcobacillus massiliensis TaxID=521392 RepID=UPI00255769E1|nr:ATP-dependent DNA helicase RecG [Helcobacillus massiliensis]MDK7742129.1 ATP-dependent DNA helicase RecG [Helcobacillus massiliensis]WOO93684.1 ATP-dependent DNA helicase RecG [Helcobacillus massiliensis]
MQSPALTTILSPKELKAVRGFGVETAEELLRVSPNRYKVPGPVRDLHSLQEGDDITVIATVIDISEHRMRSGRGTVLTARIEDDSGDQLDLPFFLYKQHLVTYHRGRLRPGVGILVQGTVKLFRGQPQVTHPDYTLLTPDGEDTDGITIQQALQPRPVYPQRSGSKQSTVASAFDKALDYVSLTATPVPGAVLREHRLLTAEQALTALHRPRSMKDVDAARRFLRFEEAFIIQSAFARRRARDAEDRAPALDVRGPLATGLDQRLPFSLTDAQQRAGAEIEQRISTARPTSVLLQGDVGSGKTIVALRAMVRAIDSGHQAALLAPTDVLARQHHATIMRMLGDLGEAGTLHAPEHATTVRLLTGSLTVPERRQALLDMQVGTAGLIVGTHALLSDGVDFADLGLVVIDEQHRFGVEHRRMLRAKGSHGGNPHVIVMTATPIPRTAAISIAGDLDVIALDTAPAGRAEVQSFVVPESSDSWRERMWERTAEECRRGMQAFVVCPRISPDDDTDDNADAGFVDDADPGLLTSSGGQGADGLPDPWALHSVEEIAEQLQTDPRFRGLRIATLHGRQHANDKQKRMEAFAAGQIDVLVATTVVEVGVDIPNATVMVVLDAERFGLSQLHQLRGRIGRSDHPGIAFFTTRAAAGSPQHDHLKALADTRNGFELAEIDLERRGGGDLIGTAQSGMRAGITHLNVLRDAAVIAEARQAAFSLDLGALSEVERTRLTDAIDARLVDADVERS